MGEKRLDVVGKKRLDVVGKRECAKSESRPTPTRHRIEIR
jgi:hypothetical protein